ncbi:MAG: hypothetical protein JSS30_04580 [Verrucomicrobia bacterium]|nr:hypothetical protein [Verrucomicrobiota bacterium]
MEIVANRNNILIGGGSLAGLTAGAAVNYLRSGSLFSSNPADCALPFNGNTQLQTVNSIRQKLSASPYFFFPLLPLIHTVPMAFFALWNTIRPTHSDRPLLSRGWENLTKLVLNPILHQNLLYFGIFSIVSLYSKLNKWVAPNVVLHSMNLLYAYKSQEGLQTVGRPAQKKIYTLLNLAIAVTDAVWLYNTAANCHSVSEVVSGIALAAAGIFALETTKGLLNQGLASPLKNHSWVALGSLAGIVLGSAHNLIKRGSLLAKDMTVCSENPFGGIASLTAINHFREQISLLFGLVVLIPPMFFAIYNIAAKKDPEHRGILGFARRSWQQLSKNFLIPTTVCFFSYVSAAVLRNQVAPHLHQAIDTSGHIVLQIAFNFFSMKALQGISETGSSLQKRALAVWFAATSITDAIWLYNTAGNCHSVADSVGGLALITLGIGVTMTWITITKNFFRRTCCLK